MDNSKKHVQQKNVRKGINQRSKKKKKKKKK
jgi:hypothetical protein